MGEIIKVERTTPYGFKLQDGSYRKSTENVRKFFKKVEDKPCRIDILEEDAKNGITKIAFPDSTYKVDEPQKVVNGQEVNNEVDRQTSIIRQSCLKCACSLFERTIDFETDHILEIASEFEKWVSR